MSAHPPLLTGVCHAFFAYDIGIAIDLDKLQASLSETSRLRIVRLRRPAPAWFEYEPAPLRLTLDAEPIGVGPASTQPVIDCLVYDFGAIAVTYRLPFHDAAPESLIDLSAALYDNQSLLDDSRARAGHILKTAAGAVQRPHLSNLVEDYLAFAISQWGDDHPAHILDANAAAFAAIIQSERTPLSEQQITQAISARMGYSQNDLAVVDWNAAILFDHEPSDIIALLAHANIELLEMRWLDSQLDQLFERAPRLLHQLTRRRFWPAAQEQRDLRAFAELQTDSAMLFEGVNNAIKLLGDQYLARLYKLVSEKFHLPEWDASVLRKLSTAESVYQKMSDAAGTRRLEVLELVIIALIFISIVMPFIPGLSGK